ncbi:hypothetical protein LQ757_03765 [Agromyces sp. SYSU K20354]|uniref:hypothetical protein n=1 Tax=Agromyces cavernae TaxID=2898659 RepID=UPI001E64EDE3|nr:hypothetical protein [Agromyces cavernae]MCD2441391.1 hypothetical protein [Agromyces cavernae]
MKLLPLAALAAAAVLSTIMAADIVWNAHNSDAVGPWLEGSHPYLQSAVSLAHGGVYVLLGAALIQAGRSIDGGRVLVRVLRWIIIAGYAIFAALYGWTGIIDPGYTPDGLLGSVVNGAFLTSLLVPVVLGFALIRRRELRLPVMLLIAPVALLPLTIVLGMVGTWGHPGYMETAVNFGVALLCIAASTSANHDGRADSVPTIETAAA